MTISADNLRPGQVHTVKNQGRCISPQTINIVINWIGPTAVHYYHESDTAKRIKNTSLDRFLEILNQ